MLPRVRVCEIANAPESLNLSLGSLLPLETSATFFYICISEWSLKHEHAWANRNFSFHFSPLCFTVADTFCPKDLLY